MRALPYLEVEQPDYKVSVCMSVYLEVEQPDYKVSVCLCVCAHARNRERERNIFNIKSTGTIVILFSRDS